MIDEEALARTALLLRLDVFHSDPSDDPRIVAGLRASTARVVADQNNLMSYAGQTALVTLCGQLAMFGMHIDLDVADVALVRSQPPLTGDRIGQALSEYLADLMPSGNSPSTRADVTFALGDTHVAGVHVRVAGNDGRVQVGNSSDCNIRWVGDDPVTAMAASTTAAADGVRASVPRVAEHLGVSAQQSGSWSRELGREVALDLRYLLPGEFQDLGDIDLISGGAISNAALFTLLRLQTVRAAVRVIEPDTFAASNLNRYALGRRSHVNLAKVDVLESFGSEALAIVGVKHHLDDDTAAILGPLSSRVLVGVDDIPSRWAAQRLASGLVVVGSTSHDYVVVSAHPVGGPCAGCTHPKNDDGIGDIPTISFVSFWAGMLQALELLRYARLPETAASRSEIYPLSLDKPRGLYAYRQGAAPTCPVRCTSSATRSSLSH
ncbi:hypothetical protein ACQPYH_00990 [Kribbella sp. CA-245084]|uniref:hypothetical protein n=1 Tax=Kribbella sp. CA-245084 TaxID=3239940 RepID=UPI003D94B0CF